VAGARSLGGWWCYMRQPGAPSGVLKSKTGETDKRREEYFLKVSAEFRQRSVPPGFFQRVHSRRRPQPDMFSPTGSRDPVFECASPSNPLQTRRSAAAEAQRLPQEEHTWTAGDWVVGRNAKAEFALTNDDLASIDVRRVGGGRLDIRRPKKYYSRPDLHRLSEQKHGGRAMWKTAAQRRRPIRPPAMIRPASAGSSSGWPPVLASLGQPRPAPASPGQPRPASAAGMFWLAGHARLVFHIGPQGIAKHGTTKTTLTSPLRMTRSRVGKSACQSPKGKSPRGLKQSHV
jgi:hypothetical protein